MTVAIAAVLAAGGAVAGAASPPDLDWSDVIGRRASRESVRAVVAGRGTIVVVGTTNGALGGQVSHGATDAFVRAYRTDGAVRWTHQFGTTGEDRATGVAIGTRGHIYVVGETDGALPGQRALGDGDAFVQRWTASGRLEWTRQFGTGAADLATAVNVDSTGEVTVVGVTAGAFRRQESQGDWDVFVRRYSAAAGVLWTRQFGTTAWDQLVGVAEDGSGGVVVTGHTDGTLTGLRSGGGTDVLIRAYTADGRVRWTRQVGTTENDLAAGISPGPDGGTYMVGMTGGTFRTQTPAGGDDAFVVRMSASGRVEWIRQFGTGANDQAEAVAVGPGDRAIVAGTTSGDLAGRGARGQADAFLRSFAPDGTARWTVQTGTPRMDNAHGVAVDAGGGICLVGMQGQSTPSNGDGYLTRFGP